MKNFGKTVVSALVALSLVVIATPAFAQVGATKAGAQTVTLNDKIRKNVFQWLSEAPMEKIKGTAPGVTGTLTVDPANLSKTTGTLTVPVRTMKTGNATRDGHLQGADWLDGKKFPNLTFKIQRVSGCTAKGAKASCKVAGAFTCHGVTKQITASADILWKKGSAKTARKAPGDWLKMKTEFTIKLADYKVAGSKGVVGDKVGKTIKIWATLYGNTK